MAVNKRQERSSDAHELAIPLQTCRPVSHMARREALAVEISRIVRQKVSGARLAERPTDQRRQRIRTQVLEVQGEYTHYGLPRGHLSVVCCL